MLRAALSGPVASGRVGWTLFRTYATKRSSGKAATVSGESEGVIKAPAVTKRKRNEKRWGIFGDIHFDDRTLSRVVATSEWITKAFRENQVSQIICMGDVLNTREVVSVQSLSAAAKFFDELSLVAPVHVILGNHDMNLKHSGKVSSLDMLDMRELRQRITLHRDITPVDIEDVPCAMIPYQESGSVILNWMNENKQSLSLKNRVAFAHMALEGAIQRYQKDNKSVNKKEYHEDDHHDHSSPKDKQSKQRKSSDSTATTTLTPRAMQAFKRVFSGHFHHHHTPAANFVYVGAPMQHTYGDSGDDARGVVLYDPSSDEFQFVQNPEWDTFRMIKVTNEKDLAQAEAQAVAQELRGKYVSMLYTGEMSMDARRIDGVHDLLLKHGAKEARKALATTFLSKQQKSVSAPTVVHHSPEAVVPAYVTKTVELMKAVDPSWKREAIDLGREIISTVSKREKLSRYQWAGDTFVASLASVTMENFLGVRESIMVPISTMRDGVWFLTGANGSGKSTLLEAVTWCLFDKFLRSDMKSDYAVNDTTKKNCVVRVAFDNGYEVERFRKHKEKGTSGVKVYKDGKYLAELERGNSRDSQRALEGLLGISFETFTKAVVLGDNASMNFLMSDSKRRRETIEELLEMDVFDLFLVEARDRKKALQQRIDQELLREEGINRDIQLRAAELERNAGSSAEVQAKLRQARQDAAFIEQKLVEWQAADKELATLEQNWNNVRNEQRILDKWEVYQSNSRARQLAEERLVNLRDQHDEQLATQRQIRSMCQSERKIRETDSRLAELQSQEVQLQSVIARQEQRITEIDNQKQKMHKLISAGKCPTCQQTVTAGALHDPHKELATLRSTVAAELEATISQQQALQQENQTLVSVLNKLLRGATLQEFMDKVAQRSLVDRQVESLAAQVLQQEQHFAAIPDPMNALKELNMPLAQVQTLVTEANNKSTTTDGHDPATARQALHDERNSLLEEKFRLQSELTRLRAALKEVEVRHNEITEAKNALEAELASMQASRSGSTQNQKLLEFWEKGFDRRTLKNADFPTMRSFMLGQSIQDLNAILGQYSHIVGAGARLGISFNTDLELNEDFGKRSAGQRKRNDIVIMLSLFELIRQRGRFRADFVMLDEVFDALDVNGQLAVQELLAMLAERVSKVFVITHSQPHLMSKNANVITVSMTPKGTAMETVGSMMY